ncbi:hypothetical protein LEP1GSC192_2459 [Leptospira sp. B5-022]|nr:hypothetical protein LEP1GSC192_2459 [Leptospira sp. B5-022]
MTGFSKNFREKIKKGPLDGGPENHSDKRIKLVRGKANRKRHKALV